jgi:DNA invertase Pin-like site-specific DNA recombinase
MSPKSRGVLYGRMSTTDQEDSIAQQVAWAEPACVKEHVEILARFLDEGKSGHDTKRRTDFQRMLDYCRQQHRAGQPIDVIVCWHANRFSRADSQETSWFLWEFRKAGVEKMLTSTGWLDFTRMEDRIIFGINQDASNHKFSQDLAAASTRGKIEVAKSGRWAGGPIPYGYRARKAESLSRKGKVIYRTERLVPDPETAPIVRWLFETYARGEVSLWDLVIDLNRRGVPPPTAGRKKGAKFWNHRTIQKILRNEVYLGDLLWNRRHEGKFMGVVDLQVTPCPTRKRYRNEAKDVIRREGKHDPLVDRATFDACQRQLLARRTRTTPIRGGGNFLLSGLLKCGHCEKGMGGRNLPVRRQQGGKTVPTGKTVPRYVCASYFTYGKSACNYNCIDEAPLVAAIARKVRERFGKEFLDAFRRLAVEEARSLTAAGGGQADQLRRRIGELEASIRRGAKKLLEEEDERVVAACRLTIQECTDERDRLAADLAKLEREEGERIDPEEIADECVAVVQELEEVLAKGTPAEVRAVLHDIIDHVELWFRHEETARETHSHFARGLIYLREDTPLASCLGTVGTSCSKNMA